MFKLLKDIFIQYRFPLIVEGNSHEYPSFYGETKNNYLIPLLFRAMNTNALEKNSYANLYLTLLAKSILKAPYSLKIDIFISERFNKFNIWY